MLSAVLEALSSTSYGCEASMKVQGISCLNQSPQFWPDSSYMNPQNSKLATFAMYKVRYIERQPHKCIQSPLIGLGDILYPGTVIYHACLHCSFPSYVFPRRRRCVAACDELTHCSDIFHLIHLVRDLLVWMGSVRHICIIITSHYDITPSP